MVEDAHEGQELEGWVMDSNETVRVRSLTDIPLGHKIAVRDIGRAVAEIPRGGYVHAHNIKTKRW